MKKILFLVCLVCVGCQQYNDIDRAQLKGSWQDSENSNCQFFFKEGNYLVRYNTECFVSFTYELYDNQLVSSSFYKPLDDSPNTRDYKRFTVVYNCGLQGDSILHLSLKSCNMDKDYVDPCGWSPQRYIKLLRTASYNPY